VSRRKAAISARARSLGPDLGRELSTWTILFHQAVAERLGLNVTDHKCLDFLGREGAVTAGRLAEVSGLTTGAVTGVIDRLEKAGFVRRREDPEDRRRLFIEPVPGAERRISPLFASLRRAMGKVSSRFTDAELDVIADFLRRSIAVMRDETHRMRAGNPRVARAPRRPSA
jgi:DNA-binding MarR family transcriptional regulator